jgi:acetyl-CoA carboxylase biotin carboxyl carrier protein
MSDAGLVDDVTLVDGVAVGPGDAAGRGYADGASRVGTDGAATGMDGAATGADGAMTSGDGLRVDGAGTDGGSSLPIPVPLLGAADASLLGLIDRLTSLLDRGDLGELEVSSGGTTIVLRAPSAIERPVAIAAGPAPAAADPGAPAQDGAAGQPLPAPAAAAPARPSVKAPLTGIYYAAPSPGATPYVAVGDHVSVGQIIGLIEAMKLFNEIKSDLAGRVARMCVDSGALVKAKQPLIEVDPA